MTLTGTPPSAMEDKSNGHSSTGTYRVQAESRLPVLDGTVGRLALWASEQDQIVVLEFGNSDAETVPLVRVHSACFTGDLLGSLRCDCGVQLKRAQELLATARWGLLVYPIAHEGRGIGLTRKIMAYAHQDRGLDTFAANRALGLPDDARDYRGTAEVLRELGATKIALLTRNPHKIQALEANGIDVVRKIPLDIWPGKFNHSYLDHKYRWFEELSAKESCVSKDGSDATDHTSVLNGACADGADDDGAERLAHH